MKAERIKTLILGDNLQTASLRVVVYGLLVSVAGGLILWLVW